MILNDKVPIKINNPLIEQEDFVVKVADSEEEIQQALRLRFKVFNLELSEGLDSSFSKGLDMDDFDDQFVHLVVIYCKTNKVIATYRVQNYTMAKNGNGFYSAERFDFSKFSMDIQKKSIETSRACVARPYRNSIVMGLLWKGLAALMLLNNVRYFFGCSSVQSTDQQDANGLVRLFNEMGVYHDKIRLKALEDFRCDYEESTADISQVTLPPLFSIYLKFKCTICSDPCFDRDFKTITFLILLDVNRLPSRVVEYFAGKK
ncbi:MAG: GNAT family N-acetyltransferase [Candidatus Portiera sp.]|nr:GNAT family N-acetyltransferase [Portiera sp.]